MSSVISDQSEKLRVNFLGCKNVASPYVENLVEKEDVAAHFLESICIHDPKRVEAWISRKYGYRSKEWMDWVPAGSNPLDVKLRSGNGLIIPQIVASDDVRYEEAIRRIIHGCGFQQLGNYLGEKFAVGPDSALCRGTSIIVVPPWLVIKGEKYFYTDVIYKRNCSKMIDSGFARYCHHDGHYKLLPLAPYLKFGQNIPSHYLSLGVSDSQFGLLNADVMNSKRNLDVLIFANLNIAHAFSLRINNSSIVFLEKCISTSHYGGSEAIENVDYSSIRGQNAYIIPDTSKQGYIDVFKYVDKCIAAGAYSVSVVLDPVFEFDQNLIDVDDVSISCPFQRYIANNGFCYKEKELSPMIHRFLKHAIPHERFHAWAQDHMLINVESSKSADVFSTCVTNGLEMIKKPLVDKDESNVSIHNLLSSDKLSMVVGFSHEGKTVFSMSLILSYIAGIDIFLFNNNKKSGKVLLIDSESCEDFVTEVLLQLSRAYGIKESVLTSFTYMSLLEMPPEFAQDFDLLSESTQLQLKQYVKDKGISLIVLDNLQSMFENVTYSPKMLRLLIKFIELMQSMHVAVLLLHHTLDSNKRKPQGLTQLVNRMRNIMLLEGYSTLMPEMMKLKEGEVGDPFVHKFIDHKGVTFRLVFTKCNSYQHLRNQKFLYHLHYKNVRKCIPTKWISDADEYDHLDDDCNQIKDDINYHNCCDSDSCVDDINDIESIDDFKKYCNIVQSYAQDHPDFNSTHIQAEFTLTKREAKKVLDHLVDAGILDKTGVTSNRKYRIRFQDDNV